MNHDKLRIARQLEQKGLRTATLHSNRSQNQRLRALKDFKSGARPATVMHQHAKGYTDTEIDQLADFFAGQKPTK